MNVKVWSQLLIPSVKHHRKTDFATKLVLAELDECLGSRVEQQLKQRSVIRFAAKGNRVEFMRQREHVVKVWDWQQVDLPGFPPRLLRRGLAFGAMPVATTVIEESLVSTVRAPLTMTTQNFRSAVNDLPHHFQMTQRNSSSRKKRLPVLPKDIGQLESFTILRSAMRRDGRQATYSPGSLALLLESSPSGILNKSNGLRIPCTCLLVTCR